MLLLEVHWNQNSFFWRAWNPWWADVGNILLKDFTFSAAGIQAGGAPCACWNSLDLPWGNGGNFALGKWGMDNSIQTNVSIEWFQRNVTSKTEKLSLLRGLLTKLCALGVSRAVFIGLNISSGRERGRVEQGTVAQRKTCPCCVTKPCSELSWDVELGTVLKIGSAYRVWLLRYSWMICFPHGDSNFLQLRSITSLQDVCKGENETHL